MTRRIAHTGPVRRRGSLLTAIVTAGLCVGALITPAPASAADDIDPPDIFDAQLNTDQAVVPASGTAPIRLQVRLSDPQGVADAFAHAVPDGFLDFLVAAGADEEPPDFSALLPAPVALRLVSGTVYDGVWAGTIRVRRTNLAGRYTVGIAAMDRNENMAASSEIGQFRARYGAVARADFSPGAVAPGGAVAVTGRLARVTPTGWAPFAHRRVDVQFRPAGAKRWNTRGSLLTAADGTFTSASRFHAQRDGDWRVHFSGGRAYAPDASAADTVTVS